MRGSYSLEEVEALLLGVFDEQVILQGKDPHAADEGMPRSKADPSHGFTKVAMLADVRRAWELAGLTEKQKVALFRRYVLAEEYEESAHDVGVSYQAMQQRCAAGLERLVKFLNGEISRPRTMLDFHIARKALSC